ncbi:UDP-N-acetylglucosamine--N-acetylmuramyl-(pentapeptide) pyrophosphoryl-undecaprenol N-acetylglucosamine transferase, partial [Dialister hominis]|uniref:UDP-N-acetylglucosamine--N-acetylmuramyl- (pentapeptide) pyrophosphoryl-undecaprenol N-acetylglucosamine transferase n=1 Tax=Dialister hominis TaxID=2582419 RepID=UPI003FEFA11C
MKRIILSGGGTGGHIYPAITIAKEISRIEEAEILFVGTPNGMESKIIPKEGYKFASIHAYGLKRSFTVKNIANLAVTAKSVFRAKKILKEFNPDVVIGTGGYVCGPILMAAALQGITKLIQDHNDITGKPLKIQRRCVDLIAF